jgi:Leucine-rich repeat (LRR) protein
LNLLERLFMSECNIHELPNTFGNLINMVNLDLSKNKLSHIGEGIFNMTELCSLDLSDNLTDLSINIDSVLDGFYELKNLQTLTLRNVVFEKSAQHLALIRMLPKCKIIV